MFENDFLKCVRIFDSSGNLKVNTKTLNGTIDISHLSRGAYVIELLKNNGMILKKKFIK